MIHLVLLILGVLLLTAGGELLIRGALAAARRLNISPLLSGLVIVGFGTSAPELVVSVHAALNRRPDIAVGNVVGSNIANILLILGLCALITPLTVKPLAIRRDAVTGVGSGVLFLLLVGGQKLGRTDGMLLLAALTVYLIWACRSERSRGAPAAGLHKAAAEEIAAVSQHAGWTAASAGAGLVLLILGSQVLLKGAAGIAVKLGVSEAVIGLTLVAVGTSLPELTISVIAAFRHHADVAVGNVLGSNIFNLLGILGISALLQPLPVTERIRMFDQWILLGVSILLFGFLCTGQRVNRLEGGGLLLGYVLYLGLSFTVLAV